MIFLYYEPPTKWEADWLYCGSTDPHPFIKKDKNLKWSTGGSERGTEVTGIGIVNSKIFATPTDQTAFILALILLLKV